MKVFGTYRQEVEINPIDVVEELLQAELGREGWLKCEEDKFFIMWEEQIGPHDIEQREEIDQFKYNYIRNLQEIFNYLKMRLT